MSPLENAELIETERDIDQFCRSSGDDEDRFGAEEDDPVGVGGA
jgi:hypothetical protein